MNFNRILLSVGVAALLFHTSCESKHAEHEEDATFQVTNPIQKDTVVFRDYVSQIRSSQHIELRALEKGYLQNIYVDEGQFVKKGQLMFRIMPVIYQSEMEIAKAEANFAEIEYLNTKSLADSNVVSQNELALAKARLTKAKAELSLAEAHLGFTEIRAPFDGIMGRFNDVRQGSLLDEGELLTTLSDNAKMWVYFNVPEAEYLDLVSSSSLEDMPRVHLQMANHKRFADEGVIEAIESDFNNETGNIAFRATFQNANRILRHGETGNIQMPVPHPNALIIPQKATFEILDKKFVFVVGEDGVVKSRQITIATELPHLYIISDGLAANEKILIEGLRKVENNQKIKFEFVNPEKVLSELNSLHAE
ncbi:efflux RND transporter periplasmic adaptor subunit [Algoriphagus sp. H41]|uniref:Efflux RND transporter periplasmic adaptor subunit n=1 Tax=Algoriphagus oliviformis TaxID=2811231 RepID=A0ABS3C7M0_9BACT|nr:efflux RND transporter periplasmic adaptor subunit [Algoriphagus oliviformis]MBN7812564.1 efflux RND transporter periplasmic adaptor subunit [Algoriphagus oliviformis]